MTNPQFVEAAQCLMRGEMICPWRHPDLFHALLDDEAFRDELGDWFHKIDRRLARLQSGEGFYLAHMTLSTPVRAQARRQFAEISRDLQLIIGFLALLSDAALVEHNRSQALQAGQLLDLNALVALVNDSEELEQQLRQALQLLRRRGRPVQEENQARLKLLLDYFSESPYRWFTVHDRVRQRYQVTSEVDYLYDVLAFIAEHHELESDEELPPEDAQEELL